MRQLDLIHRARISLNQNQRRVRLICSARRRPARVPTSCMKVWQVGTDVDQRFAEWKPEVEDGVAAVLVKPDGIALTWYANGFDASGLRKDLAKVTK